jgi:hypothetical protein
MNQITQDVIEFLTHPDLDFGDNPMDAALLDKPELLQQRVRGLLEVPPPFLSSHEAAGLRARLDEADWPTIALEFRTRLHMAAQFFQTDAKSHQKI